MKRFIKNFTLFAALVCVILLGIVGFDRYVIGGQYQLGFQASLVDKVARLQEIREPKIILVGNSNLAFGVYSDRIEAAMGMPVVNLGLHGGLGNAYLEEIAKLNIGEGDLVIVCHSDYADDDKILDPELAWVTYDYQDALWPIIRPQDYAAMLTAYPAYLRDSYLHWITGRGNRDSGNAYSRNAFNAYGDVIAKYAQEQMDTEAFFQTASLPLPDINDTCTDRLNRLNRYCRDRGAVLLAAGYPIAWGAHSEYTEADFCRFQAELEEKLDFDVISDFRDYFFPYEYFFDTGYHLNETGAIARTEQLIADLTGWLARNGQLSE